MLSWQTWPKKKMQYYLNVIIWDVIDKVLDFRLDIVILYSFQKHLLNSEQGPETGHRNQSSHIPCSSVHCVGRPPPTWTGDFGAVWHAVMKARARSYGNTFKRDLRGRAAANMYSVPLYSALHVHLCTPLPSLLLGCRRHISTYLFCLQGLSYSRCFLNN